MKVIYLSRQIRFLIDPHLFNVSFDLDNVSIKIDENNIIVLNCCKEEFEGKTERFLCITVIRKEVNIEKINLFTISQKDEKHSEISSFYEYVDEINSAFDELAYDIIKKIRWLTNLPFDINKKGKYQYLKWSTDKYNWIETISNNPEGWIVLRIIGDDIIKLVDEKLIRELVEPNLERQEPLAHDLLMESKRLLESNDLRGAFITGFIALEIGVKKYIISKRPETSYLIANTQSPNIYNLLKDYLPTIDEELHVNNRNLNKGKERAKEYRIIEKYMEARNALVHKGNFNQTYHSVAKQLHVVEFFLHKMDYSNGLKNSFEFARRIQEKIDNNAGDAIIGIK